MLEEKEENMVDSGLTSDNALTANVDVETSPVTADEPKEDSHAFPVSAEDSDPVNELYNEGDCTGKSDNDELNTCGEMGEKPDQSKKILTFEEQEAMLNAFFEEEERKEKEAKALVQGSPKPKRKSIKELLKNLPGNVLSRKPMIRPSSKQVIDLNEDFKTTENSKKKGIEDLMSRFMIHTAVKRSQKEEHYKLHITKREEDSQGIVQIKVDEAEYIKPAPEDDSDEERSPLALAPGSKMAKLKARLMADIKVNRAKAMAEKMKMHAMYSEEKELNDKGDNGEEEEILLDEDMSDDSDVELEEGSDTVNAEDRDEKEEGDSDDGENKDEDEEDIEALLDGTVPDAEGKKLRKRLVYLEDEASESGEDNSGDENEDFLEKPNDEDASFIDDRPESELDSEAEDKLEPGNISLGFDVPDHKQQEENKAVEEGMSQDLFSEAASQALSEIASQQDSDKLPQDSPLPSLLDPNRTPKVSAAILNHNSSPLAPWNSGLRYQSSSLLHPGRNISPLIPRLNSSTALDAFCEENQLKVPKVPEEVAKLVGTPQTPSHIDEDDLEGICSARFPSQQPKTPQESQEFDYFGFEEDFEDEKNSDRERVTRIHGSSTVDKALQETPKTGEKVARTTRLNFQDTPSQSQPPVATTNADDGDDESDDGESAVGLKQPKKRKRRLLFSDDEESDEDGETDNESVARDTNDDSDEDIIMDHEEEESETKFKGLISRKTGKIRAEFVEGEAELSGSDQGSADEDEAGIDEYEEETGDIENIDEDQLREQVGRVHLKQMLDDDQREIRQLKETYLEDGELHGDGQTRQRTFKWRLTGDYGLSNLLPTGDDVIDLSEDPVEKELREKERDKLKWKQSMQMTEDAEFEETSQKLLENSQFLKLGKATLRKLERSTSLCEKVVEVTKSPGTTFVRKGSFLQRENTLSRLAEMAKISDSMSKVGAGKGFVFTMVTPPTEPEKHKGNTKRNASKNQQPKKMLKTDRSLSASETQANSIFKWM